ncbi:MAG: DNA primase [Parvularculaceae bacterium]|nr:DNA primase [Parvularculaceae bacterium]
MPRFTPEFLDELRARVRVSDVVGRSVKLQKRGNAFWGLSPFKKEKTPSFTVDDNRQSYHCFSTGQHGDIIRFLMETKGLSFPEAVEQLAADAGMELPRSSPEAAQEAERRKGLIEACEAAAGYFQSMLRRAPGRQAADYLERRRVGEAQIEKFRIGFAPAERTALRDYLVNKGYTEQTLIDAGLIIRPDDGGAAYDRFRNRVMFPILGARDAVIAFGGRALDADARAKYLNSPETKLFHKGDVLYNHAAAREAAAKEGKPLIVCEGYMDVIALWGAGFKTGVAPLGTALTENQLALLWRQSDEPLLCFDGDSAGLSAAYRSVDRALPLLKPGKSLTFALLPEGRDPDDIIRIDGAAGFARIADEAHALADILWRRESELSPLDTPERRAALRARLRDLIKGIADKDVRQAYGVEFANRLRDYFAPVQTRAAAGPIPRSSAGFARRRRFESESERLFHEARLSPGLKQKQTELSPFRRGGTLVLGLVNHPGVISLQEEAVLSLQIENPDLDELLSHILGAHLADPALDSEGLKAHLHQTPAARTLQRILTDETLIIQRFLRPGAELDDASWGWKDALRHHLLATSATREVAVSASQMSSDGEESWKAAVVAREELLNSGADRNRRDEEGEAKSADVEKSLESMRASVSQKHRVRKPFKD